MDLHATILAIALLLIQVHQVSAICYYPDGSTAAQDVPCTEDTTHATCCGAGYACLSNFMCQATGAELQRSGATEFVRGSCTDESWRSGSCPSFCVNPDHDLLAGGMGIGRCETGRPLFYCINSQESDCDSERNVLIFQNDPTPVTTIGVQSTTSSTSTTSETSETSTSLTASTTSVVTSGFPSSQVPSSTAIVTSDTTEPAAGPTNTSPRGDDGGVDALPIGIGVGVGVGATLLLSGIAFLIWRRRSKAKNRNQTIVAPVGNIQDPYHNYNPPMAYQQQYCFAEMPGYQKEPAGGVMKHGVTRFEMG